MVKKTKTMTKTRTKARTKKKTRTKTMRKHHFNLLMSDVTECDKSQTRWRAVRGRGQTGKKTETEWSRMLISDFFSANMPLCLVQEQLAFKRTFKSDEVY